MNEMTMGLRNKVVSLKEATAEIREGLEATKNSKDTTKLDDILQKLSGVEETLQSFILEKERRVRKEDEDEEETEYDPEEKEEVKEEAKEETEKKEEAETSKEEKSE